MTYRRTNDTCTCRERVGDVCVLREDSFIVSIHRFDSEMAPAGGASIASVRVFLVHLARAASGSTATGSATAAVGSPGPGSSVMNARPPAGWRRAWTPAGAGAGSRTRGWARLRRRARRARNGSPVPLRSEPFFRGRLFLRRRERTAAPEESLREAPRAPCPRSPSGATRTCPPRPPRAVARPRRRRRRRRAAAPRPAARSTAAPGRVADEESAPACDSASRVAA